MSVRFECWLAQRGLGFYRILACCEAMWKSQGPCLEGYVAKGLSNIVQWLLIRLAAAHRPGQNKLVGMLMGYGSPEGVAPPELNHFLHKDFSNQPRW